MSFDMVLCCDASLTERIRTAVGLASDALRNGRHDHGDGVSSWTLESGSGGFVSVNVVDGGITIDTTGPDGQDLPRDLALTVPMLESHRHHDREAVLSVVEELRHLVDRSLAPDDPDMLGRIARLQEMAKDMSAVLASNDVDHTAVSLRCGMQRRASAFVDGGRGPKPRLNAPYANWNDELQRSPHGFAEVVEVGTGGTHLIIGGGVVKVDSIASSSVEVLRRLPRIAPHLRKMV